MERAMDVDELVQILTHYSNKEASHRIGANFLAAGLKSDLAETITLVYLTIKNKPSPVNCAFQLELYLNLLLKNQALSLQRNQELSEKPIKKKRVVI